MVAWLIGMFFSQLKTRRSPLVRGFFDTACPGPCQAELVSMPACVWIHVGRRALGQIAVRINRAVGLVCARCWLTAPKGWSLPRLGLGFGWKPRRTPCPIMVAGRASTMDVVQERALRGRRGLACVCVNVQMSHEQMPRRPCSGCWVSRGRIAVRLTAG
jgi:hypothetical protein